MPMRAMVVKWGDYVLKLSCTIFSCLSHRVPLCAHAVFNMVLRYSYWLLPGAAVTENECTREKHEELPAEAY